MSVTARYDIASHGLLAFTSYKHLCIKYLQKCTLHTCLTLTQLCSLWMSSFQEALLTLPLSPSIIQLSSVGQSHPTLRPHELRHARLPCPHTNFWSLLKLMSIKLVMPSNHLIIVVPFCFQSFPASGSFPMSQFFTSGGQSIGVSASASVLPMNVQD